MIALVAAVVGAGLLIADRNQGGSSQGRERRRWAALRGWRYVDADPVLPEQWTFGALADDDPGEAVAVVSGRLFTAEGRRPVLVFDHVRSGRIQGAVVCVHRNPLPGELAMELWLASVPFPHDAGLELLGPVGQRYAFVTDLVTARPLLTPELVDACDELGEDVPVIWCEQDWVLASTPATSSPSRLEQILRTLGEIADQLDGGGEGGGEFRALEEPGNEPGYDVDSDPAVDRRPDAQVTELLRRPDADAVPPPRGESQGAPAESASERTFPG